MVSLSLFHRPASRFGAMEELKSCVATVQERAYRPDPVMSKEKSDKSIFKALKTFRDVLAGEQNKNNLIAAAEFRKIGCIKLLNL